MTTRAKQAAALFAASKTKVQFEALATQTAVRPGGTLELVLRFRMPAKWHIYWRGFNDTGLPPTWTVSLPKAWAALVPEASKGKLAGALEPELWPAPTRYVSSADTVDAAYFDELVLVHSVAVPAGLAAGEYALTIDAGWLVCDDACIPEDGSAEVRVHVLAAEESAKEREGEQGGDAGHARGRASEVAAQLASRSISLRPVVLGPQVQEAAGIVARRVGSEVSIEVRSARSLAFLPSDASLPFADLLGTGEVKREAVGSDAGASEPGLKLSLQIDADLANGMRAQLGIAESVDPVQQGKVEGVVQVVGEDGVRKSYWLSLPAAASEVAPAR